MNRWQIMLTTDSSIANAVGMLLDIIDNCGFQMDGAPMIDREHVVAFVKTGNNIIIPFKIRYK